MTAGPTPRAPARGGALARACDAIDAIDDAIGRWLGPVIIGVACAIIYEIVARSVFTSATVWANESVVYGSAAVYLLAGGYAMRHGRHVKLDGFVAAMPARVRRALPLVRLPFLLVYALTLVVVGGASAWTSFLQGEATGTPWNPPIWPIKACIPAAGLLLALQMLADTARELGWAPPRPAP
jgi:TRAP-type mannitol/chloroaromatic compound transport system permease small subunit